MYKVIHLKKTDVKTIEKWSSNSREKMFLLKKYYSPALKVRFKENQYYMLFYKKTRINISKAF